jgi:hypothetical protein
MNDLSISVTSSITLQLAKFDLTIFEALLHVCLFEDHGSVF